MANSWANKYHNRWFVRIAGNGEPVYGSLISRANKPRGYGNYRFIEITQCLPNNICCTTTIPSLTAVPTGTFETGGTVIFTASNSTGVITTYTADNNTTVATTLTSLISLLNSTFPGLGTFTATATDITLAPTSDEITGIAIAFQEAP